MGLQLVEIVLALEDYFGVSIPDAVAGKCITVGDLQKEIANLLAAQRHCEPDLLMQEVWQGMLSVISEQMDMQPSDIKMESTWVGDITKYG